MLVKTHLRAPSHYQTAAAPELLPDTFSDSLITNYTVPLCIEPLRGAAPFVVLTVVVLKNGASVYPAKDAPGRWISSE